MDEIDLSEDFRADLMDYIINLDQSVGSINTIKSYKNIIDRIFKHYNILNRENEKEMLKRWGKKTKIRAVFSKLNEFFYYSDIDYTLKLPKGKRSARHIPEILTREELKEVMKDIADYECKLIISCIFNIGAGLRISELINLRWEDIDWKDWSEKKKTISVKIKNSKGNKDRIVPIPHFTTAELYKYAEDIGNINEDGIPRKGLIFDFGSGNFKKELRILDKEMWEFEYNMHSYDFIRYNIMSRYFSNVNGKRITAHSLRHSRATELHNVYGVPISKIQKWLGHSDISTTMIYVHMATKDDEKLMEEVGGV